MQMIALPDGAPAWVCDTAMWAIYPEKYRELRDSQADKSLREVFGGNGE